MCYGLCFGRLHCPSRDDSTDLPGRSHVSPPSARAGDFDACEVVMGCQFPAFLCSAFQAQLYRFPYIAKCFPSRAALADTARNHGTLRNNVSIVSCVEYDWQLHGRREYHLQRLLENLTKFQRQNSGRHHALESGGGWGIEPSTGPAVCCRRKCLILQQNQRALAISPETRAGPKWPKKP